MEQRLQDTLEAMYRIDQTYPVTAFLVEQDLYNLYSATTAPATVRESLLVLQEGEEIEVALYLSKETTESARAFIQALSHGAIAGSGRILRRC